MRIATIGILANLAAGLQDIDAYNIYTPVMSAPPKVDGHGDSATVSATTCDVLGVGYTWPLVNAQTATTGLYDSMHHGIVVVVHPDAGRTEGIKAEDYCGKIYKIRSDDGGDANRYEYVVVRGYYDDEASLTRDYEADLCENSSRDDEEFICLMSSQFKCGGEDTTCLDVPVIGIISEEDMIKDSKEVVALHGTITDSCTESLLADDDTYADYVGVAAVEMEKVADLSPTSIFYMAESPCGSTFAVSILSKTSFDEDTKLLVKVIQVVAAGSGGTGAYILRLPTGDNADNPTSCQGLCTVDECASSGVILPSCHLSVEVHTPAPSPPSPEETESESASASEDASTDSDDVSEDASSPDASEDDTTSTTTTKPGESSESSSTSAEPSDAFPLALCFAAVLAPLL